LPELAIGMTAVERVMLAGTDDAAGLVERC
jgi:hypothetical protein